MNAVTKIAVVGVTGGCVLGAALGGCAGSGTKDAGLASAVERPKVEGRWVGERGDSITFTRGDGGTYNAVMARPWGPPPRERGIMMRFLRVGDALVAESRLAEPPAPGPRGPEVQYSKVQLEGDRMTMAPLNRAWTQAWEQGNPDTGAAPAGGGKSEAWTKRMLEAAAADAGAWGAPEAVTRATALRTGGGY